MSCYRQYKSEIKDLDVMERGLVSAGLVCKRDGAIVTYGNRNQKVDLAVSEDGGKSFHFGLQRKGEAYDVVVEHDYIQKARVTGEKAFVERMETIYNYQVVLDGIANNDGMAVEETVGLDKVYSEGQPIVLNVEVADHLLR